MISMALGFISSPVGKGVGIALAVGAAILWLRHDAAQGAREAAALECRQQTDTKREAELARQLEASRDALASAQRVAAERAMRLAELRSKANELLTSVSGDSCPVGPDLRRQLQSIR